MEGRGRRQRICPRHSQYGETWKAEAGLGDGGGDGSLSGQLVNGLAKDLSYIHMRAPASGCEGHAKPCPQELEQLG